MRIPLSHSVTLWRKCCPALLALPALLLVLPLPVEAGGKADESRLTLDRIFKSADFNADSRGAAHWLNKLGGYAAKEPSEKNKGSQDIVRHDPETGKKEVLIGAWNLIPPGGTTPLNIENFHFSANEGLVLIYTNSKRVWRHNDLGDYWLYDLTSAKLTKIGGDAKARSLQFAKFSPDSKKVSYVRDKNIYVEDVTTHKITQLTTHGPDVINGTFDWVYEEELDLRDGVRWSPDSKYIAFWQLDTSGVKDYHLINNTDELYSKVITLKYPKVGETNSACKVGVVPADGSKEPIWIKLPGDPRDHYIARMGWTGGKEPQAVVLQQLNRLQNTSTVFLAHLTDHLKQTIGAPGGPQRVFEVTEVRQVLQDKDKAWVEVHEAIDWIDEGKEFTWISDCDGWRHVYAASRAKNFQSLTTGEKPGAKGGDPAPRLITPGKFDVIDVLDIDEDGGWLYYYASPDNPAQKYLYRAKLDGSKQEKLTPDDQKGTHTYDLSPDCKWAIHTFSSMNTPPVTTLISLPDHKEVRVLASNKKLHDTMKKLKIRPAEFFRVNVGEDLELDAYCIKPPDFDPAKKYPVLFYVYGEPAAQTVVDRWGGSTYLWHQMLAQQGYVVMSVDNRGTPSPRGREFRKIVYKQIGSIAPVDQANAVKAIQKKWSWVDPARVGIWGWSGGGTSTLMAMFRYPDLYKTGMAIAAVTNERFYDSIYSERYMGLPGDNVKGYKECSPITYAGQLKGNLLIVHGTGDDNVHYANAEALINELIAQNKQFTMMAYPNRSHSISEGKNTRLHLFSLLTNYLHKNLPAGSGASEKETNGKAVDTALAEQPAGPKDELKELQKERVKVAKQIFDELVEWAMLGKLADYSLVVNASKTFLDAQMDLCETKAERIKALEDGVERLKPFVDKLKVQWEVKKIPRFQYLSAQEALLEVRIALEKAKKEK